MEHTSDNINTHIKLLPLLLKLSVMFKMHLCCDNENIEENVIDNMSIRCSNCGETTGLYVLKKKYKDIVTKFFLNKMLHHVGLSCIIKINKHLEYYIYRHNPYWLTNGTLYNKSIRKKLHGTVFGKYIRNSRTDRCNFMCSIGAHDKQRP